MNTANQIAKHSSINDMIIFQKYILGKYILEYTYYNPSEEEQDEKVIKDCNDVFHSYNAE